MKKLLYTVAFTVIGFTASYAQKVEQTKTKATAEERAQKHATHLQTKLNLSEEQKAKVEKLELDRYKKNEESRKRESEAMKARAEARKAENAAHEEKINKILTKEQQEKLSTERAAMREKAKEGFRKRGAHKMRKNFGAHQDRPSKDTKSEKSNAVVKP